MTNMPDYSEVKNQMIATRYRFEQNFSRLAGIAACKLAGLENLVVECAAGYGGLTEVYKKYFQEIINNDINPESVAIHNLDTLVFIKEIVAKIDKKIDMIDFDSYVCPAYALQEFFKIDVKKHAPFVIALSDAFGMHMKYSKNEEGIRNRYLIDGPIDTYRIWDRHADLIDNLLKVLSKQHGLQSMNICNVQTKSKNYVLGSYVIYESRS